MVYLGWVFSSLKVMDPVNSKKVKNDEAHPLSSTIGCNTPKMLKVNKDRLKRIWKFSDFPDCDEEVPS